MKLWVERSLLVLVCLANGIGCSPSGRDEATRLAHSVDRFRASPNDTKSGEVTALEALPCSIEDVCSAKETCLSYARPTAQALALKSEVARGVESLRAGRLQSDDPSAKELPNKLNTAERLLAEGHKSLEACDSKVSQLRKRYSLPR